LSGKQIDEYKKLIKEKGLEEALKIMQSSGGLYEGDFVKEHKTDPDFGEEKTDEITAQTQEMPVEIKLDFANNENQDWEAKGDVFDINDKMSERIITIGINKMKLSNTIQTR
jgi:hypothetical protein